MWKTTFVASGYICFAVYFDFVKVIFRLTPKLRYLSITCPQGKYLCVSNITVEDNITP